MKLERAKRRSDAHGKIMGTTICEAMNDDPDETFVIDTILRHRPRAPVAVPVKGELALFEAGDDAARFTERDVVTVDAMVEGTKPIGSISRVGTTTRATYIQVISKILNGVLGNAEF